MAYHRIVFHPDKEFAADTRLWNGCPSVAVTGKRIWASFFTGGKFEPSRYNYVVSVYSDDGGKTWVDPYMVVCYRDSDCFRAMDNNYGYDPKGRLWYYWERMHFPADIPDPNYDAAYDAWLLDYFDENIETWGMYCENPEADEPLWSEPKLMFRGSVLRNKPITLSDGTWLLPTYLPKATNRYQYYISKDCGETFEQKEASEIYSDCYCPEPMMLERKDGSLLCYLRTYTSFIAEMTSSDGGKTWSKAKDTTMPNPSARFYLGRLRSGNVILVNTPQPKSVGRLGMSVFLSEDDGATWKYRFDLDDRESCSYPDVDEDADGNIYIVYDVQRDNRQRPRKDDPTHSDAEKEIVLARVTEEDIRQGKICSEGSFLRGLVTKCSYDGRL